MFRAKNNRHLLQSLILHVSLLFIFLGCGEISNKTQDYLGKTPQDKAVIYSEVEEKKREVALQKEKNTKVAFIKETLVNQQKVQIIATKHDTLLSKWWLLAIGISIITIIYFIALLMKKQKIILEQLQKKD